MKEFLLSVFSKPIR